MHNEVWGCAETLLNFNYGQVKLKPNFTLTVKFTFALMVYWQSLSAQTLKFLVFGDSICLWPSKFLAILRQVA